MVHRLLRRRTPFFAVGNEPLDPPTVDDHYMTADAAVLSPHFYHSIQSLIGSESSHLMSLMKAIPITGGRHRVSGRAGSMFVQTSDAVVSMTEEACTRLIFLDPRDAIVYVLCEQEAHRRSTNQRV
jgi:hypothetical protein